MPRCNYQTRAMKKCVLDPNRAIPLQNPSPEAAQPSKGTFNFPLEHELRSVDLEIFTFSEGSLAEIKAGRPCSLTSC